MSASKNEMRETSKQKHNQSTYFNFTNSLHFSSKHFNYIICLNSNGKMLPFNTKEFGNSEAVHLNSVQMT